MKITACSIVKNEAQNITRSIKSYKDAVDEIIIVDTGSTDNTVEICKSNGTKVLFYQWNNDFSAAKNYALEHATGDWIIFLDADEWFDPKLCKAELINIINKTEINKSHAIMTTLCEYNCKTNKVIMKVLTTRIFRNSRHIRFEGAIHERITNAGKDLDQECFAAIEIFHSGYANGLANIKAKRNMEILNSQFNKGEVDAYLYFYIFRENYLLGNIDEAEKFFDLFLKCKDAEDIIESNTAIISVYEYMYRIMVQKPEKYSPEEVKKFLLDAIDKYPEVPILSYFIGCEMIKSDYCESYKWLINAINENQTYDSHFVNSFIACLADTYYKLGYISHNNGNDEQALIFYIKAIREAESSDLIVILQGILEIIGTQPEEEIILFLNSILDIAKEDIIRVVLTALKETRLHKAFIYYAVKYNKEFNGQDETTYIAMILMGQEEMVVETAIVASENAKKELRVEHSSTKKEGGNKRIDWHLDYAVIAILHGKRYELFNKYRSYFDLNHSGIIEAFFNAKTKFNLTPEINDKIKEILEKVIYLFDSNDINRLESLLPVTNGGNTH